MISNICAFAAKCIAHSIESGLTSAMNSYNKTYEDLLSTIGPTEKL